MPMAWRPHCRVASRVLPLPMKQSSTVSLGREEAVIIWRSRGKGFSQRCLPGVVWTVAKSHTSLSGDSGRDGKRAPQVLILAPQVLILAPQVVMRAVASV